MKLLNHVLVGVAGLVSLIYLINPTAGFIEFIPDNVPFFGNLDEAAAVGLLLSALAYFGLDLNELFGRVFRKEKPSSEEPATKEREVAGKVVEP